MCYPKAGFSDVTEELLCGDRDVPALQPACFLPGLLMKHISECCCSWEPKQPGYPRMALDISRQLSLQLMMTSHGRATPWHSLSPGVLILFIDISPKHLPGDENDLDLEKVMASGLPFLVFSRRALLSVGLSRRAFPTRLLSSPLRMWGLAKNTTGTQGSSAQPLSPYVLTVSTSQKH